MITSRMRVTVALTPTTGTLPKLAVGISTVIGVGDGSGDGAGEGTGRGVNSSNSIRVGATMMALAWSAPLRLTRPEPMSLMEAEEAAPSPWGTPVPLRRFVAEFC